MWSTSPASVSILLLPSLGIIPQHHLERFVDADSLEERIAQDAARGVPDVESVA